MLRRRGLRECALVEQRPVVNTSHQATDMDVIEVVFGKRPLELSIIDFEFEVRWYPLDFNVSSIAHLHWAGLRGLLLHTLG
jgi:hypothetical protein